ncbi:MAG TPA: type II toxin-antitoxin system VapC family toxin [Gammaproteobacteria bacterium]|nr:type II toxin-antitoxin system VapC family toxin [Gammaproteobacteria bacterium]
MIGLDTNVVVRYLVQDDRAQASAATALIERTLSADSPGLITGVTLCEIVWVLAECYAADRSRVDAVIEGLLTSRQLIVEDAAEVWAALGDWRESNADFSDALIGRLVAAQGGAKTVTFDRSAAKLPSFELLK